jgi:hypothetical protein
MIRKIKGKNKKTYLSLEIDRLKRYQKQGLKLEAHLRNNEVDIYYRTGDYQIELTKIGTYSNMRDSRKEILIEQCDFIVKEDIE